MKPHRTDGVSLLFGLIFLGVVLAWLLHTALDLRMPQPGWVVAGALVLFGAVGLVATIGSSRRDNPGAGADVDDR